MCARPDSDDGMLARDDRRLKEGVVVGGEHVLVAALRCPADLQGLAWSNSDQPFPALVLAVEGDERDFDG